MWEGLTWKKNNNIFFLISKSFVYKNYYRIIKIHGFFVGVTFGTETRTILLHLVTYDNSFQEFINKKIVIDFIDLV